MNDSPNHTSISLSFRRTGGLPLGVATFLFAGLSFAEPPAARDAANPYEETAMPWQGSDASGERGEESVQPPQEEVSAGVDEQEAASMAADEGADQGAVTVEAPTLAVTEPSEEQSGLSTHRVSAIALSGLAFLGVGVGTSYAIKSTGRSRLADTECTPVCSEEGSRLERQADQAATISRISFAIGLASLGGAAYFWLTESKNAQTAETASKSAWQFDVMAAPGLAGASVGGNF